MATIAMFCQDIATMGSCNQNNPGLENAYKEMACDTEREAEAMEWTDNLTGDAFDETQ